MKGKAKQGALHPFYLFSSIFDILKACINKRLLILKTGFLLPFHQVHKGIKNQKPRPGRGSCFLEVEAYQEAQSFYAVQLCQHEAAPAFRESLLSMPSYGSISSILRSTRGRNPSAGTMKLWILRSGRKR